MHPIPRSLDDLSAGWIDAILRQAGLLSTARVRAAQVSAIGDQRGFMGHLYRLHLDLEGSDDATPKSVVVKLPTTKRAHRSFATMLGLYEREVRFYRELAPQLPIRTPIAHYAELDVAATEAELTKFARADGMPKPFILPWITLQMLKATLSPARRYALVLEDLGHAEIGDQLAGCDLADAALVLSAAAQLHAHHWHERGLQGLSWIRPLDGSRLLVESARRGCAEYMRLFPITEALEPHMRWFKQHGDSTLEYLTQCPLTLNHGDLRLDNVFFLGTGSGRTTILADWQCVQRAPAAIEVAYFIVQSLPVEASDADVVALLTQYHASLVGLGVDDYPLERLLRDYIQGLMYVLILQCSSARSMNVKQDPELRRLFDCIAERLVRRLAPIEPEQLKLPR